MDSADAAWRVVRALLKPLIKICVKYSFPLQEFIDASKVVYVHTAAEALEAEGMKVNNSRVAVMTGVHRGDVSKIRKAGEEEKPRERPLSVLLRVVRAWEEDPEFLTSRGAPRVLSYKGSDSEFRRLVASITRHTDPGTVLFELKRAKAVEVTPRGLKLISGIVRVGDDTEFGYNILANDIGTLVEAVQENLAATRISNVHISTNYDSIYVNDLPKIRRWLLEESKAFHRRLRAFLAQHDADLTSNRAETEQAGGIVSFCSFSHTSELPEEIDDKYLRADQRSDARSSK